MEGSERNVVNVKDSVFEGAWVTKSSCYLLLTLWVLLHNCLKQTATWNFSSCCHICLTWISTWYKLRNFRPKFVLFPRRALFCFVKCHPQLYLHEINRLFSSPPPLLHLLPLLSLRLSLTWRDRTCWAATRRSARCRTNCSTCRRDLVSQTSQEWSTALRSTCSRYSC